MPELTLEQWETKAFERSRYKRKRAVNHATIDCTNPERPVITAPLAVIRGLINMLDLSSFIEIEGGEYARTDYADHVPHRARQVANAIIGKVWKNKKGGIQ